MSTLLSVQEAQQKILSTFDAVSTLQAPLEYACRRVLAEDIISPIDLPSFPNSSMDGFAVRARDVESAAPENPATLEIIANLPAGALPDFQIVERKTALIMTGAYLPLGADAVVPVEQTNFHAHSPGDTRPNRVQVYQSVSPGAYVRPVGQDIHQGQKVLEAGERLTAQAIGLLASLGIQQVPLFRLPRVAIFSSGDELITPGQPLQPGKIRDANSYMLRALVEKYGGEVIWLGIAPDDPAIIREKFRAAVAQSADLIISSAGVSVGEFDYVRSIIEQDGELNFWRVNMRPGKPLAFGSYRNVPFIGLPGNPVSTYVGFVVFVLPALNKLAGQFQPLPRHLVRVTLAEPVESDGRESYLRVVLSRKNEEIFARLTGHQGSGNLFSLVQANALLIVPAGVKSLPIGAELEAWLLDDLT